MKLNQKSFLKYLYYFRFTNAENINFRLSMVMKTGQYVLYEQKLKSLLNENAKLVINTKHRGKKFILNMAHNLTFQNFRIGRIRHARHSWSSPLQRKQTQAWHCPWISAISAPSLSNITDNFNIFSSLIYFNVHKEVPMSYFCLINYFVLRRKNLK